MKKTIKTAAMLMLSFTFVAAAAVDVSAGCKKGGSRRGGHGHHHYHRPVYVKPAYCPPKPPPPCAVAPAGATMTLPGYYGKYPGHVILELAGAKLHAKVIKWTPGGITLALPRVALAQPTPAKLIVIRWDKYAFKPFHVKVLPPVPPKKAPVAGGPKPGQIIVHLPAGAPQGNGPQGNAPQNIAPQGNAPQANTPQTNAPAAPAAPTQTASPFGQGGIPFQQ